jgi:2-dehydropantoate 2-reductase
VLIVGTGALACLFAARLARAGVQVTMLGTWTEGLRALGEHGVRLADEGGDESGFPVQVIDAPEACAGIRFALVLVKSWQTVRAARQLGACLAPDGLALTLQNGLGNRATLVNVLGEGRVALGVTTVGATLLGPGRVRQAGEGRISLGAAPPLGQLHGWLEEASFAVEVLGDADSLLWGKLVVNAAINPLTAILRVPNGELLRRGAARALMGSTAQEAAAVAGKIGLDLPYADPVEVVEDVVQKTAHNHSSMFQDIQRGAPTEIDAICGAIVATGESVGAPVAVNRTLWRLVKALEVEAL